MERTGSCESRGSLNGVFRFGSSERRFPFSRQASFQQSHEPQTPISIDFNDSTRPFLSRTSSSIEIPPGPYWSVEDDKFSGEREGLRRNFSLSSFTVSFSEY
ncbi:hypothetical protein L6164_034030 [Bauhinia variegata]|uniref:Uncharacterized protein n=1 Tax=Bauhinia variegata TaxID=167791 RepID=A0ACB9KTP4_BAUVA|nr:hypothetical protein L6164_034030 [Bauhinia variegata]